MMLDKTKEGLLVLLNKTEERTEKTVEYYSEQK